MKARTLTIGLLFFFSCAAPPPMHVTYDFDRNVNFRDYRTFAMAGRDKLSSVSELNADRIYAAIRAEMTKKGFTENATDPDLKIHPAAVIKNKTVVSANTDYYGYGGLYRPYPWGGGGSYTTYDVSDYVDGSLIIDVVDHKRNQLLWEGIGNQKIDKPLKDPDTGITQAVAKIMENFPPQPSATKK